MSKKQKKPYSDRTDIEKIESNWTKTRGLYDRDEWSGAIVRAATAVEIAANLVIREELQVGRKLDKSFVDSLLIWANGIQGKLDRLILPAVKGSKKDKAFTAIKSKISDINKERNGIVHSGQFKKNETATRIMMLSKEVVETLVQPYKEGFTLEDIKSR
jgi:hypothetical protein